MKRNLSSHARTQRSGSLTETFLRHNKKHITSYGSSPINRKLAESKISNYTVCIHTRFSS